jgi:hypothetical protein
MKLSNRNYYGPKANREFMSVSQYKAMQKCEAAAMAEIKGEYTPERGRALILGSYVDELLTGTAKSQEEFISENRTELYQKSGKPYADIVQADIAVERVRQQPLMMHYLNGQHQKIIPLGPIFLLQWIIAALFAVLFKVRHCIGQVYEPPQSHTHLPQVRRPQVLFPNQQFCHQLPKAVGR